MQNPHFGSKIKIAKNMSKSILKEQSRKTGAVFSKYAFSSFYSIFDKILTNRKALRVLYIYIYIFSI